MGVISSVTKAAAKAAKAKKVAAKLAAAKKAAEAKKKAKAAAAVKKAKIKKDYAAYVKQYKKDEKAFAKKANTDSAKEEAYESSRLDAFTNPPDRSTAGAKKFKARNKRNASQVNLNASRENAAEKAAAKRAKAKAAIKSQKPKTKPKKTFESEMRELKSKLMTAAAFQREASKLAVKYGKTIKIAGKVFGPKKGPKKGPPISRERIPGVKRNKKGEIIDRNGT